MSGTVNELLLQARNCVSMTGPVAPGSLESGIFVLMLNALKSALLYWGN